MRKKEIEQFIRCIEKRRSACNKDYTIEQIVTPRDKHGIANTDRMKISLAMKDKEDICLICIVDYCRDEIVFKKPVLYKSKPRHVIRMLNLITNELHAGNFKPWQSTGVVEDGNKGFGSLVYCSIHGESYPIAKSVKLDMDSKMIISIDDISLLW